MNPGAKEDCLTKYDDNCDGDSNDKNASNCVTYYQDGDGDGFGVGAGVCMCAPVPALDFTAKKTGDCDDKKKGSNTYSYGGKDLGQSCGVGICSGGTVVCSGKKATCSTLSKALSKEICNGKDDTCDGSTDNNPDLSSLSCKTAGVCASVTKSCQSGTPICEYSKVKDYEATEASCDNKDNDCDGQTDESLTDVSQSTCLQVGVCTTDSVKASCSAGKWTCDYSAVPNYESATQTEAACDSKDNDCDGKTDEGC